MSRIVDSKQIRKPENLHDALANLCQLFAATVGEDDVKLFKYHVKCDEPRKWTGTVVEIHVPAHINFKWNHSNLDQGRALGKAAAEEAIAAYNDADKKTEIGKARFINERKDEKKGQHDAKSGEEVEPDENGRYRKGSIPYTLFAIGYPEVRRIYDRLGAPDPGLEKL